MATTPNSRKQYWMLLDRDPALKLPMQYHRIRPRVDDYFNMCKEQREKKDGINPTLTGLAFHLGFSSVKAMRKYTLKPEFAWLITTAMTLVENYYESVGSSSGSQHSTFAIFALKNMGWTDVPRVAQDGVPVQEVIVTIQKGDKRKQVKDGKVVEMKAS